MLQYISKMTERDRDSMRDDSARQTQMQKKVRPKHNFNSLEIKKAFDVEGILIDLFIKTVFLIIFCRVQKISIIQETSNHLREPC